MNKKQYTEFKLWLKEKKVSLATLSVAAMAIYVSHWKAGIESGIY